MSHTDQHIDAYDWYNPQTNPLQTPFGPRDVYVDYSPAQISSVSSESSPKNLTSLLSSSSPKIPELLYVTSSPAPPITFFDVTTSPAEPAPFVEVDLSPKWPQETSVDSSPKNIEYTEVDTDPYAPISIAPATDPYPADNLEVDSSPKNILSVDEDFFLIDDPLLGLWRFDSEPSDYISLLSVSQETDEEVFPAGGKYEILKVVDTYTQEGLYSSTTYIETQDAMLGGGEPNQVFDMEDQDTVWSYIKFAAAFDPHNHTIYREVTRPPLPPVLCEHIEETVEVASLEVEFSPSAVVSLSAGELSYAITSVTVQSSPKPVELQVVAEINTGITSLSVGLLPEAVSSVTPQSSPKPITSIEPESSPKGITSAVADSTPKPLSSFAVDSTPATVTSVSGESSPKPVTSTTVEVSPASPASISSGAIPFGISEISADSTPANVVSILVTDEVPDAISNISAGAFPEAPALTLVTDSEPTAVTSIDSKIIPKSVVSVGVESTPKPVTSVVPDLKPAAPFIIHSQEIGENSPIFVLVSSSPKPAVSIEPLKLIDPVASLEVLATPKAVVSVVSVSTVTPVTSVFVESSPKPVEDVDPLVVVPVEPVASLNVQDVSGRPLAPENVFISGLFATAPTIKVTGVFVDSSPKPVDHVSGGDLSLLPEAPIVLVASYNTEGTGTGVTTGVGSVGSTVNLSGYAPSRPTAINVQSNPKDPFIVEVEELPALPPVSIEVDNSPAAPIATLSVNNSTTPIAPDILQVIGVVVKIIREEIPQPPEIVQITAVRYLTLYVDPPFQPSVLWVGLKPEPVSFFDATDKPPTPVSFIDATDAPPASPIKIRVADGSAFPEPATEISVLHTHIVDGGNVITKYFVSGGNFSQPYYTLTDINGNELTFYDLFLFPGRTYIFEAASDFNQNHPLILGTYDEDADVWLPSPYAVGNPMSQPGDEVGLILPDSFDPDLENVGFYCNVHGSAMAGNIPTAYEPRTEGGGVDAGGSGPGGATGTTDGGGTSEEVFEQTSTVLRLEVDSSPFPVDSLASYDISKPLPVSLEVEVFQAAETIYGPTEPREYFPEDIECFSETPVAGSTTEDTFALSNLAAYWDPALGNTGDTSLLAANTLNWDITGVGSGSYNIVDSHHRLYEVGRGIFGGPRPGTSDQSEPNSSLTIRKDHPKYPPHIIMDDDRDYRVDTRNPPNSDSTYPNWDDLPEFIGDRNRFHVLGFNDSVTDPQIKIRSFNDYLDKYRLDIHIQRMDSTKQVRLRIYNFTDDNYITLFNDWIDIPHDKPFIFTTHEEQDINLTPQGVYAETYRRTHFRFNGKNVFTLDFANVTEILAILASGNSVAPEDRGFGIARHYLFSGQGFIGDIFDVGQARYTTVAVQAPISLTVEHQPPAKIETLTVSIPATFELSSYSDKTYVGGNMYDIYIKYTRTDSRSGKDCSGYYQMTDVAVDTSGIGSTGESDYGVHWDRKYNLDGTPCEPDERRRYFKARKTFYPTVGQPFDTDGYALTYDNSNGIAGYGYEDRGNGLIADDLIWDSDYLMFNGDQWRTPMMDRYLVNGSYVYPVQATGTPTSYNSTVQPVLYKRIAGGQSSTSI